MLPHIYFLHVIREYLHRPPKEEIRTTLIPTVVKMCKIIRDAGARKGPGGQTLLKGTNKILIMLESIPWNLEG